MNTLLFEMVAARAMASGNPAVAEMLARLKSSPDANPNQTMEELLARLGPDHPMAAVLAKHLADSKKRSAVIDVESVEETEEAETEDAETSAPPDPAMSELREHVESMFAELTLLRERSDNLAAAVGACCLCWGDDAECRVCRGRGRPGFAVPDRPLFEEFVLPAVLMLRAQKAKAGTSSPGPHPGSTDPGV
jgi:hypothetical protein